ncbi:hypothetical protein ACLMJK_002542 [Lecanora helva]
MPHMPQDGNIACRFVTNNSTRSDKLTKTISRSPLHTLRRTQIRFCCVAILLVLLAVQHAIASTIASNSVTSSDGLIKASRLNNSAVGVPVPPPAFHVKTEIGGPALRKTSCLLVVIEALKQLALGDFDTKIVDGTGFQLTGYPEVSILVNTPRRKRNVLAKYVIWALIFGVEAMVDEKKFELAQFELTWNGQTFGWVHIVDYSSSAPGLTTGGMNASEDMDTAKRSLTLPPTSNITNPYIKNTTNFTTTNIANDAAEARLSTMFHPMGGNLGVYDVFLPIMNSIADMATRVKTVRADGLVAGLKGRSGIICIVQAIPTRTSPPYLEYQWLIRTVARIPIHMVESHRFGELDITMTVDGTDVAYGKLTNLDSEFCSGGGRSLA